eukprot:scaffold281_cov318-Pavlova_lutheri.AAC.23
MFGGERVCPYPVVYSSEVRSFTTVSLALTLETLLTPKVLATACCTNEVAAMALVSCVAADGAARGRRNTSGTEGMSRHTTLLFPTPLIPHKSFPHRTTPLPRVGSIPGREPQEVSFRIPEDPPFGTQVEWETSIRTCVSEISNTVGFGSSRKQIER